MATDVNELDVATTTKTTDDRARRRVLRVGCVTRELEKDT